MFHFKKHKNKENVYNQTDCIFCLEELKDVNELYINYDDNYIHEFVNNRLLLIFNETIFLDCNHCFHLGCYLDYLLNFDYKAHNRLTCPICRTCIPKKLNKMFLYKYERGLRNIYQKLNSFRLKTKYKMIKQNMYMFYKKIKMEDVYLNDLQEYYFYKNKYCEIHNIYYDLMEKLNYLKIIRYWIKHRTN
jgi:hypothetical protein